MHEDNMKTRITKEEFDEVKDQSRVAKMFMEQADHKFIHSYINKSLESIKQQLFSGLNAETNIHLTENQTHDLQAQYRWITEFLAMMEYTADSYEKMQKAIKDKIAFVDGGEKDVTEPAG